MYNLTYKSADAMKKTKDVITNQLPTLEKQDYVSCLATLGVTHIAISTVLDSNVKIVANGTTPSPRTIEHEVQDWCDVIHAAGPNVIHRGTFCGIEAIWNFGYDTITPPGSAASAASDGSTTWCGRYYNYLYNSVGTHVRTGDIFAPIPEGTTHAFDGHFFVSGQAAYAQLFADFHTITNTYAAAKGVSVTFMSHNNYSEVRSGWALMLIFSDQGIAAADYYGEYQGTPKNLPSDYVDDWLAIYNAKGVPVFQAEWGDINGSATPTFTTVADKLNYLISFYKALRDNLVDTGKMTGFNYWGGWEGQNTSILYKDGNGKYQLNAWGQILKAFYTSHAGIDGFSTLYNTTTGDHDATVFHTYLQTTMKTPGTLTSLAKSGQDTTWDQMTLPWDSYQLPWDALGATTLTTTTKS